MKIVIGIGNPGRRYAGTRHNVGFRVIETLAGRLNAAAPRDQFKSLVQEAFLDEKVVLARPMTYVNLSGEAVRQMLDWFKCEPQELIVICDDMYLRPAQLRIRRAGGSGGHNGLKSIIKHLGTQDFPRIRIGIGEPGPRIDGADYVLGKFTDEEEPFIEQTCRDAADAAVMWVREGIEQSMNTYNRRGDASSE